MPRVGGTRWGCFVTRPRHAAGFASSARAAALQSALLVTRAPVVLQEPTALEREVYRFHVALSHRLQQPFAREQYFKKGSAAESRFDEYYAQLQKTWDIHTTTKAPTSSRTAPGTHDSEEDMYATMPRQTQADVDQDVTSLERALDRTLYLVVKRDGCVAPTWHLPTKALPDERTASDSLHDTAMTAVTESIGSDMDLWLVSKLPIAVVGADTPTQTYILKAHILAGSPTPAPGVEYAWLTREELQARCLAQDTPDARAYWQVVQDVLDA